MAIPQRGAVVTTSGTSTLKPGFKDSPEGGRPKKLFGVLNPKRWAVSDKLCVIACEKIYNS